MNGREALIGYSGFVGGNLDASHAFSDRYNSQNINDIRGQSFDLVVSAGVSGVKWLANKEPEQDAAGIKRLTDALSDVKAGRFVLISTLNVYPDPRGVDEDSAIDPSLQQPYGHNRYVLEQWVRGRYPNALIVRLPGLFGPGLKKNVLFDLIQGDDTFLSQMHVDSIVQFYDLRRLWSDIQRALDNNIPVLNFATEPMKLQDIARECFKREFPGRHDGPVYHDDIRTEYATLWDQSIPYLYSADQVMADLKDFLKNQ
jgi:nucleoside-diphosphate-sugar epimerase